MLRYLRPFACLAVLGMLLLGCASTQGVSTEEPNPMSTPSFLLQHVIQETTLLRLGDGWEVGLQMVYQGEYTDASGKTLTGLLARISVWDGKKPKADTLEVYEGAIFQAGKRYQVVEIAAGSSGDKPGTRGGYLVIGQLP